MVQLSVHDEEFDLIIIFPLTSVVCLAGYSVSCHSSVDETSSMKPVEKPDNLPGTQYVMSSLLNRKIALHCQHHLSENDFAIFLAQKLVNNYLHN